MSFFLGVILFYFYTQYTQNITIDIHITKTNIPNLKIMQALSLFTLPWLFQETTSLNLNVTAISARDGSSTLECWQMDQPFDTSTEPGISGTTQVSLGTASSLAYSIIPPDFDGGVHNAPENQYVALLSKGLT